MHPTRFGFLAVKQQQAVVSRDIRTDGTYFVLECGHTSEMPPHFDGSLCTHRGCMECGKAYVMAAPQYASEFNR